MHLKLSSAKMAAILSRGDDLIPAGEGKYRGPQYENRG